MTDFQPGEIVVSETGNEYEVMFGPYADRWGADAYLVKSEHGDGMPILASSLYPKPTDPRRDVVAKAVSESDHLPTAEAVADAILAALDAHSNGQEGQSLPSFVTEPAQVTRYTEYAKYIDACIESDVPLSARMTRAAFRKEHDTAVANPSRTTVPLRRYTDRDGDIWEERPDDRLSLVEARESGDAFGLVGDRMYTDRTSEIVENMYGPLDSIL